MKKYVSKFSLLGVDVYVKDQTSRDIAESTERDVASLKEEVAKKTFFTRNIETLKRLKVTVGDIVLTSGYYDVGVGDAKYLITNEPVANDCNIIKLENGLTATLLDTPSTANFGIRTERDEADKLQLLLNNENCIFTKGKYYSSKKLVVNHNCNIYSEEASIYFTGSKDGYGLWVGNDKENGAVAVGNLNKADTYITLNSNFKVGDFVKIYSAESWNGARPSYNRGEIIELLSGSGTFGCTSVQDFYTSASAVKLDTINFNIEGSLKIYGDSHIICLAHFDKVVDSSIDNLTCSLNNTSGRMAIELVNCCNLTINNLIAKNTANTSGDLYGFGIVNCQKVNVLNGEFTGGRHGVTLGYNLPAGNIVNRFIEVNGTFNSYTNYSADMHGNSEYCKFTGLCLEGVTLGGNRNSFKGHIETNNVTCACIRIAEANGAEFDFSGCTLLHRSSYDTLIYFGATEYNDNNRFGGVLNFNSINAISVDPAEKYAFVLSCPYTKGYEISVNAQNCMFRQVNLKSLFLLGGTFPNNAFSLLNYGGTDFKGTSGQTIVNPTVAYQKVNEQYKWV